jgi:hypothetical protein
MQIPNTAAAVRRKAAPCENGVQALLRSLEGLGISPKAVAEVLPPWWDNSIADDPSGLAELKVMLARRLSLDPKSLFGNGEKVDFLPVVRRYKGGREDLIKKLGASTGLANGLCRTALSLVGEQQLEHLKDPVALRQSILATGAPYVGLNELLNVCWRANVPVLHVTLPEKVSKFDALVVSNSGRYAVALCRKENSEAWLAFHLAHELGHIARGHLELDGMLVDEKIDTDTAQQEVEANDYAAKLMGSADIDPPKLSFRLTSTASQFAAVGKANRVSPGHLVLKAGSLAGNFGAARRVLDRVELAPCARQLINERSAEELAPYWNYDTEEFISQFFYKTGV